MNSAVGDRELFDRLAIREVVESWSIHRDNREWDRFLALWHEGGSMMTTWAGKATAAEFVAAATAGFERGVRMLHGPGGVSAEVAGDRGLAISKLRIMQRGTVESVLCDVTCVGVNFDFLERREGRWGLLLRQPVYERDYLAPVDPAQSVRLDPEVLARRPDGYARLAYLQEGLGYSIGTDLPTETGAAREALAEQGRAWLRGEALAWPRSDLVG